MDPRITPARPDLAAEHLRGNVNADRFAAPHAMAVAVPWLDMFDKPGGRLTTQLLYGDIFDVYEKSAWYAWGQNRRDGYVGYVVASRLHEPAQAANYRVVANWAHVYPRPNMKLPTDRQPLPFMSSIYSGESVGGFAHVEGGFCPLQSLAEDDIRAAEYVSVAERFVGVPYLWGGCTPLGFDCSGLLQIALLAAGRRVPRDSDQQVAVVGEEIAADLPLRRGDLIFWDGHVGIMQNGETMIHANAHHMAVVSESVSSVIERSRAAGNAIIARRRIWG